MITHYDMASRQPIEISGETTPAPVPRGADTLAGPALQVVEARQTTAPLPVDLATADAAAFVHRQAQHG